ncbi:AMP-dependent synthetase/ligase [Halocatena halophila]|uniref:AMP-dependent synthetase/ligase n=1 Tax=Halocatena halophila TaxID=2814576 RepID=UPI002ECFED7C
MQKSDEIDDHGRNTPGWLRAERSYEDEVIGEDTLGEMFVASARRNSDRDAQRYKGGIYDRTLAGVAYPKAPNNEFASLTYDDMLTVVQRLGAGFIDLGVERGDRVGLFANTRMEWAQCDFALLSVGAIVTTVYTESNARQVQYLLDDSGASGVICENEELLDRVLSIEDELDISFAVVMDSFETTDATIDVYSLADIYERGKSAFEEDVSTERLEGCDPSDLASLVYTSGTTGDPKGVMLTHRNFRANVNQVRKRFGPRPDKDADVPVIDENSQTLSFLPLAHVFERLAGHFSMFATGGTVAYAESPDTVSEDLEIVKPSGATSVPRVYERIFEQMRSQASGSDVSERIFHWSLDVAREYSTIKRDPDEKPNLVLQIKHAIADKLVYSSVREGVGGNIDSFISGGGSLSKELAQLFDGMGIPINEGYGLTETAPVVSTNPPEAPKHGTLGPPVVDCDVMVDESVVSKKRRENADGTIGELLVRGPNVTRGYWNDPIATEDAFTEASDGGDSWFRTGDIVTIDEDGYLIYTDRLKTLIVLDTGKNVAPQPIEDAFSTSERIEQIQVVGDDEKFIGALIVPNFDQVRHWAEKQEIDLPDSLEAICADDRVEEYIAEEVDRVSADFPKHERIKQFELVPVEWTAENDYLTPSMKKKRRSIHDGFEAYIDRIYED